MLHHENVLQSVLHSVSSIMQVAWAVIVDQQNVFLGPARSLYVKKDEGAVTVDRCY